MAPGEYARTDRRMSVQSAQAAYCARANLRNALGGLLVGIKFEKASDGNGSGPAARPPTSTGGYAAHSCRMRLGGQVDQPGHWRRRRRSASTGLPRATGFRLPTKPAAALCHYPQRQAATPAQAGFALGPIRHPERHLRDMVPALGVVLVEQNDQSTSTVASYRPGSASLHQRPDQR